VPTGTAAEANRQARRLLDSGDTGAAFRVATDALADHPGNPPLHLTAAIAMRDTDPEAAWTHISAAHAADPGHAAIQTRWVTLTIARIRHQHTAGKHDEALRCAEAAIREAPDEPRFYVAAGRIAFDHDINAALGFYETAYRLDPEDITSARNYASTLLFAGRQQEAREIASRYVDRLGDTALLPFETRLGIGDAIDAALASVAGKGEVPLRRIRAALKAIATEPSPARRLETLDELAAMPEVEDALDLIATHRAAAETVLALRNNVSPAEQDRIDTIVNEMLVRPLPIEEHPREGSTRTALVFSGLIGSVPGPDLIWYFHTLGTNVIHVRDTQRMVHLAGIESVPGRMAGAIDFLRERLQDMGTLHLATFGISSGGFAAIRYGIELGARTVVGFGALTDITPQIDAIDKRGMRSRERVRSSNADEVRNLRESVGAHPDIAVELWYGEQFPADVHHARNLDGLDNVCLNAVPDLADHDLPRYLMAAGRLHGIIATALGLDDPG